MVAGLISWSGWCCLQRLGLNPSLALGLAAHVLQAEQARAAGLEQQLEKAKKTHAAEVAKLQVGGGAGRARQAKLALGGGLVAVPWKRGPKPATPLEQCRELGSPVCGWRWHACLRQLALSTTRHHQQSPRTLGSQLPRHMAAQHRQHACSFYQTHAHPNPSVSLP